MMQTKLASCVLFIWINYACIDFLV
jgi:hypothetical protein